LKVYNPVDVWVGSIGRLQFNPFVFSRDGNKGVSIGFRKYQKLGKGAPLGNAKKTSTSDSGFTKTAPVTPEKVESDDEMFGEN